MKEAIRAGLVKAVGNVLLVPVDVAALWLTLVHCRVAELVGWPTPTLMQLFVIAMIGAMIR